jgi:hypothetical protein
MPKLEVNPYEFDSRMTEWNLKVNKITKDQLASFLKSLPDDATNTENMNIDEDETNI